VPGFALSVVGLLVKFRRERNRIRFHSQPDPNRPAYALRRQVVAIPRRTGGLPMSSGAICHQVATLDRSKLKERIGTLPAGYMRQIARGLKLALQIDEFS
jgi:hypothetical protein